MSALCGGPVRSALRYLFAANSERAAASRPSHFCWIVMRAAKRGHYLFGCFRRTKCASSFS
jgi:hypothetical protein